MSDVDKSKGAPVEAPHALSKGDVFTDGDTMYWVIGRESDGGVFVGFRSDEHTGRRRIFGSSILNGDFVFTGETYSRAKHNPPSQPIESATTASSNGWLSPDGVYYGCTYGQHFSVASRVLFHVYGDRPGGVPGARNTAGVCAEILWEDGWISLHEGPSDGIYIETGASGYTPEGPTPITPEQARAARARSDAHDGATTSGLSIAVYGVEATEETCAA